MERINAALRKIREGLSEILDVITTDDGTLVRELMEKGDEIVDRIKNSEVFVPVFLTLLVPLSCGFCAFIVFR